MPKIFALCCLRPRLLLLKQAFMLTGVIEWPMSMQQTEAKPRLDESSTSPARVITPTYVARTGIPATLRSFSRSTM